MSRGFYVAEPTSVSLPERGYTAVLDPLQNALKVWDGTQWVLDKTQFTPLMFGARANFQESEFGGAISSGTTTLTISGYSFVSSMIGQLIYVKRAGANSATLATTIQSMTANVWQVTLASTALSTVGSARVQWGTDDYLAVQSMLTTAASYSFAIVDFAGRNCLLSSHVFYSDASKNRSVVFRNGGLVRQYGVNDGTLSLNIGRLASIENDFIIDGNNRIEASSTTARAVAMPVHNIKHFRFKGWIRDATGYGIVGYQQGDGTNRDTESFVITEEALISGAWEGGVGIFNTGKDESVYYIHPRIDCGSVHPNDTGLGVQGTNGVIVEIENLPVAAQKIALMDIGGWIKVGGTAASNATAINNSNSTGSLSILVTRIHDFEIIPGQTELTKGISWENPGEQDVAGDAGCSIDVYNGRIRGRTSLDLINLQSGSPSNLKNSFSIRGVKLFTGLGAATNAPITLVGVWKSGVLDDIQAARDPEGTYGSAYQDVVDLQAGVQHLSYNNITWDDNNAGVGIRYAQDGSSYWHSVGQTIQLRRTAQNSGNYVEIGKLNGFGTHANPSFMISVTANGVAKTYLISLDSNMTTGYFEAQPMTSTGSVGGRNFELQVAGDGGGGDSNIAVLRVWTACSSFTETFAVNIMPMNLRHVAGSPGKINYSATSATGASAPLQPLQTTPYRAENNMFTTYQTTVASQLIGSTAWRGIATVNSGTTVASVAATAAQSGAVIALSQYMFATAQNSGQSIVLNVQSVRAGAFEIVCAGSIAPAANMNVAWSIVR